jgi:ketosteroid isomerase-like protein
VPASETDVAHVVRAFQESNRRFTGSGSGGLESYFEEFYEPDAVIEHVDQFPMPGRFEGFDGYRQWFADSYGPYEDIVWRIESVRAEGERVLVLLTITGRPRGEELELTVQLGNTYALRNGRIAHVRVYVGHERAVEAARDGG